ncbi:MAG: hypothetical protein RIC30_10855 [Marinoscillum sp.]|uniref:hypothetical protein n=1 Tax=Marinoscillum sp. TaxID=2024838 RepID=UPI0032F45CB0
MATHLKKSRGMIKDKIKTQKGLVKKLRAIRDKFNKDIQDMTLEEEQKYLEKMSAQWKNSPQSDRLP